MGIANPKEDYSSFVEAVRANVDYWLGRSAKLSDESLLELDKERGNLLRAIEFGLRADKTAEPTTRLVSHLFPLIERRGYWREWSSVLQAAIAHAHEHPKVWLQLQNQLGFVYRLNRQLSEAVEIHTQVATEANRLGYRLELADAHFNLANTYVASHEYDQAFAHGQATLQLFLELGLASDAHKMAAARNLLGQVADARGQYDEAEVLFEQAAGGWEQIGDLTYLARALINRGRTLTTLGRYVEALHDLDRALYILADTGSEMDKTSAQLSRGVVFYKQQSWRLAEEAFHLANSPYLQQSGNHFLQAYVYNNLGHVLLRQDQPSQAVEFLLASVERWRLAGDDLMLGNTLGALGEALVAQNKTKEALTAFEQALNLLESLPENPWAHERMQEYRSQKERMLAMK
jgi:tetratricopeptide (TPR) repeat protein